MPFSSTATCHVCARGGLSVVEGYEALPRVTSDCQPWGPGGQLAVCRECGAVQKVVDADWRAEVSRVYADYDIYAQSGGEEQVIFNQQSGAGLPRSERLLDFLLADVKLPREGRWFDIGCGNGALLRAVSGRLATWRLYGSELGEKNRSTVEAIPGVEAFYGDGLDDVGGPFEVISMVHVLEHLEDPVAFLDTVKKFLSDDGYLIVEVPYYPDNPFDLLIADHCTHFSLATLRAVVNAAGYDVVILSPECLKREISCLARPRKEARPAPVGADAGEAEWAAKRIDNSVAWLAGVMADLERLSSSGSFGIFGSSIAACFADQASRQKASCFVDEDQGRIGRSRMGRPIVSPAQVDADSTIYVPMPPELAAAIANRLAGECSPVYRCPPPLSG